MILLSSQPGPTRPPGRLRSMTEEGGARARGEMAQGHPPRIVILSRNSVLAEGLCRVLLAAGATDVVVSRPVDVRPCEVRCVLLAEGRRVDEAVALLHQVPLPPGSVPATLIIDDATTEEVAHVVRGGIARACLPKSLCGSMLLAALHLVSDGHGIVSYAVLGGLALEQDDRAGPVLEAAACSLSEQELKVLKFLAAGEANKVIARNLSIRASTVAAHIRRILQKLGMRNRTQAGIWAALNPDVFGR